MALLAIVDPAVDFRLAFGDGALTDDNMNQSGGDIPLLLGPQHWLTIASGGATSVTYRQLEVAFFTALFVDAQAAAGLLVARCALSLSKMARVLRLAIDAGLPQDNVGGVEAALRSLVTFVRGKRAAMPGSFTVDNVGDFVTLPPVVAAFPALAANNMAWSDSLLVSMCVDPDGDALVLGALINVLPHRYTPEGRRDDVYKECIIELYGVAQAKTASLGSKSARAKAACVAACIADKVHDASLQSFVHEAAAADLARSYSFDGSAWYKPGFLQGWKAAYPSFVALLTSQCSGRDAWAHASRLLFKEPTGELMTALDAKINRLMSSVDSDASLNGPGVAIVTRVAEMERLLNSAADSKSVASDSDSTTS